MSDHESGRVPVYLKLIIALSVLGLIGLIVVVVMGISLVKNNFGPDNATKVAQEFIELPDPLPKGWQYGVGLDIGAQKVVNVQYIGKDAPPIMIQFIELTPKAHVSAKEMVGKMTTTSVLGIKCEMESQGEETIGGHKAYYARLHNTVAGNHSAQEIAMVDLPDGRLIEIQSTEPHKDEFNPNLVKPLLDSVKGFGHGNK